MLEHHPMEAWLALHAQPLQQASATRQLWERLIAHNETSVHSRKLNMSPIPRWV